MKAASPIRVLHILGAPAGGIRLHVLALLTAKTPDITQWLMTDLERGDAVFNERLKKDVHEWALPLPVEKQPGLGDIKNLVRVYSKAKSLHPHIIHGHGAKGGLYARIISRLVGAKSVYSAHGGSLHKAFSPLKGFLYTTVERLLSRFTDALIFESRYSRDRYWESVRKCESVSHLIPNGLEMPEIETVAKAQHDPYRIGAFGLLRHLKGHDLLIEAVSLLVRSGHKIELRLFGEGEKRVELGSLVQKHDLTNVVRFMGDTADPMTAMSECDLVVQPSRFESFGYTVVEAMSLGLPVIASAVGGLNEIIEPEVDGILVSDLEPAAFAKAIERVKSDQALAARLGDAARQKALRRYSAANMTSSIFEVYRDLMSREKTNLGTKNNGK